MAIGITGAGENKNTKNLSCIWLLCFYEELLPQSCYILLPTSWRKTYLRTEYKKLKEGRESCLTPQRAQALETLGINESRPKKGRPPKSAADGKEKKKKEPKKYVPARPKQDANFEQKCQELREFKQAHGHTRVPAKYPENQPLAFWVSRQRIDLRKFKEGKKNHMTAERAAILDEIGIRKKRPSRSELHSFQWLKMQEEKEEQEGSEEEEEEHDEEGEEEEEEEEVCEDDQDDKEVCKEDDQEKEKTTVQI